MEKPTLLFITKEFSQHVERSSYYLANELAKLTDLITWSEDGDIRYILEQLDKYPDFILLNDFKPDYSPFIRRLKDSPVPYGIIMHDLQYKIPQRKRFIEDENIQHIFSIYRNSFYRYYPEFSDRMIWMPHHVPTTIFRDYGLDKDINLLMMGAMFPHIYPLRSRMYKGLKHLDGFVYKEHPGYRNMDVEKPDVFVGEKYARLINQAKVFLTCDSVEKFPVLKYFEAPACNTLLLASNSQELHDLGFIDGETFVAVDENNYREKVQYYLNYESERKAIAKKGMEMVKRSHSTEIRAREFVSAIKAKISL